MTDKPKFELADSVRLYACDLGHVHITFLREDGSEIATAIFDIEQAAEHALAVARMAVVAGVSVASVPGIVGGDVEKHTKH